MKKKKVYNKLRHLEFSPVSDWYLSVNQGLFVCLVS